MWDEFVSNAIWTTPVASNVILAYPVYKNPRSGRYTNGPSPPIRGHSRQDTDGYRDNPRVEHYIWYNCEYNSLYVAPTANADCIKPALRIEDNHTFEARDSDEHRLRLRQMTGKGMLVMPSLAHKKLIERIEKLDQVPDDAKEYETWLKGDGHLALLRDNENEEELIVYTSIKSSTTFIHTVAVSLESLSPVNQDDLLEWSGAPYSPLASYSWGSGRESIQIDRSTYWGAETLTGSRQLVFGRNFEGLKKKDAIYYEVLQEYAHLTEIYWRPEQRAYCRFDRNGDFDHIVSVTSKEDVGSVTLVSFKREPLEEYLAVTNSVLVRMFDFTLPGIDEDDDSSHFPDIPENVCRESKGFFYRQMIDPGNAANTRGIQVIRPSRPRSEIFSSMREKWTGRKEGRYVEFIAWDWRNKQNARISTDPDCTINCNKNSESSLPPELSIVFFNPEVLARYKADPDKYTIMPRMISCRRAWVLSDFGVNEANQVHAYISELRKLPYDEQLHWFRFKEEPKAGISQAVIETDFWNRISSKVDALREIVTTAGDWHRSDVDWWKLGDEELLRRVTTPLTNSQKEWAGAFSDLSTLVIDGFQVKAIRARLREMCIAFDKEEKSLSLIEKLLIGRCELGVGERLCGLRKVHRIRSTLFAHFGGSEADNLANQALQTHDTYAAHFESVCKTVAEELKLIQHALA